jgi:hypothetical protein
VGMGGGYNVQYDPNTGVYVQDYEENGYDDNLDEDDLKNLDEIDRAQDEEMSKVCHFIFIRIFDENKMPVQPIEHSSI